MFGSRLYVRSPLRVQEALIGSRARVRRALRESGSFHNQLQELERTQWLDKAALAEYQRRRLAAVLSHALENVPFYREAGRYWAGRRDWDPIEVLELLPVLSRSTVREQARALLARVKGLRVKGSTSGTSGAPVTVYHDLAAVIRENAFHWRQLGWAGYRRGERRAWLRGDMVVPVTQHGGPLWRLNRPERMLMMSSYHLSERTAPGYLRELEQFDPVLIEAYPSSIGFLARYLDAGGRHYRGGALRAVVTSSETLGEIERALVEKVFGCRVFDWYGSYERVAAIGTCEHGSYHVISDYGFLELRRRSDGSDMIGTGFNNRLMPLLRYDTGDRLVEAGEDIQCECGRAFPVVRRVLGRQDDYVWTPEGNAVGRLDHIFKDVRHIAEAQIVQDRWGEVRIRVVPLQGFADGDRRVIERNARRRLGETMKISVELTDVIPRNRRGKLKGVVCNIQPAPASREAS